MSITFREVPVTRVPGVYVELNTKLAQRGLPTTAAAVVLIGQKIAGGLATAGTLVEILDDTDAEKQGGSGSMLHRMAMAALTANNKFRKLYVCALADAGGSVAAAGSFAVSSVSGLKAGTLTIQVGDDTFQIGLTGTETAGEVATKINTEIAARAELPVGGSVATSTVTVTAKNKGLAGNDIYLGWSYSASGLSITVTVMTGGATDPDIQTALDAVFAADVDILVAPYPDSTNLGKVATHLTSRSDGIEQRGAIAVCAMDTTVSGAVAAVSALNSGRITHAVLESTSTWGPELAAAYASVIAGETDLARPLDGVVLKGVSPPATGYRFTRSELNTLLAGGVAPLIVGPNEQVTVCRSITTYLTDSGVADDALLDLQTIRVLDYARKAFRDRFAAKFAQKKIADEAHTENTVDPAIIRAECIALAKELEAIDYWEKVDELADLFVVERNASDPTRVDVYVPTNVVNGLHVLATQIHLVSL